MDPLSQAVVGATLAVACCRKKEWVKPAMIAGIVGGMLPDVDVLIRSSGDPLMAIQYHRHFTHAFLFSPIGGLVAALLCWPVLRKKLPFKWLYIFATLGYATHGILDAMTNYGTHLWWPFTNYRESWSIISIIDPIFTLTLLFLCALSYRRETRRYVLVAAVFACCYWTFGYAQRERATGEMQKLASVRGHTIERFEVKPSIGNLMLWRVQYEYQDRYYIDAVRVVPFTSPKIYPGGNLAAYHLPKIDEQSRLYKDFQRFAFFSDGWLATVPGNPTMVGDVRFAMLPSGLMPLWAVPVNFEKPDEALRFTNLRQSRLDRLGDVWAMIRGDDVVNPNDSLAPPAKQE